MAYTAAQSVECSEGVIAGFEKYGFDVAFVQQSLSFGFSNLGDDVQRIRDAGVEFIATCMDIAGEVQIARLLRRAGLDDIKFYAPQGYDPGTLEKYGDELNGIFFTTLFTPFEVKNPPKGLKLYLNQMKKQGGEINEQSLAGWQAAMLLHEGITLAGEDFTRQSVVDAINGITDWTADGIRPEIDWSTDGHGPGKEDCGAVIEAVDGKFVPRFGKPGQPFVCFPNNPLPTTLDEPYYKPLKPGETVPAA
jgi:ABC-type branched-subunit amino acid transport system substrate-binding protein